MSKLSRVSAAKAGALAAISPDRTGAEIAAIEQVARQALADTRRTVSGNREIRVATDSELVPTASVAQGQR